MCGLALCIEVSLRLRCGIVVIIVWVVLSVLVASFSAVIIIALSARFTVLLCIYGL